MIPGTPGFHIESQTIYRQGRNLGTLLASENIASILVGGSWIFTQYSLKLMHVASSSYGYIASLIFIMFSFSF